MAPYVQAPAWSSQPQPLPQTIREVRGESPSTNPDEAPLKVLMVGADVEQRRNLREKLSPGAWLFREARSGSEALELLLREAADILLLDAQLPDLDAAEFHHMVQRQFPGMQVLAMADAVEISTSGPSVDTPSRFPPTLNNTVRPADLPRAHPVATANLALLRPSQIEGAGRGWGGMVGASDAMQRVYHASRLVAPRDTTVLILGESGTGKDLVARAIHTASTRAKQPFVVINCAAIPEPLLEAELFGYTKGAFTGAAQSRIGRIHAAHGGTLFLDEIGDMPYPLQSKILRFLEQGEVQRIGGTDTLKVDCRVMAATNADLKKLAKQNHFREDLYYRLAIFPIALPPLRSRMEDLDALSHMFLARFSAGAALSQGARQLLHTHDWPGNVRELRNVLERASIFAQARGDILAEDILL